MKNNFNGFTPEQQNTLKAQYGYNDQQIKALGNIVTTLQQETTDDTPLSTVYVEHNSVVQGLTNLGINVDQVNNVLNDFVKGTTPAIKILGNPRLNTRIVALNTTGKFWTPLNIDFNKGYTIK